VPLMGTLNTVLCLEEVTTGQSHRLNINGKRVHHVRMEIGSKKLGDYMRRAAISGITNFSTFSLKVMFLSLYYVFRILLQVFHIK
jgi:hypothetical protein